MTPTSRAALLGEAESILRKSNFSKEDSSKVENLLQLSDRLTDKDQYRRAVMHARDVELGRASPEPEPLSADMQFRNFLLTGRVEKRALGVSTDAGGNYLVPEQFAPFVEVALKQYDQIFDAASTFTVSNGSAFSLPVLDDADDANAATIVAEQAVSIAGPDALFAKVDYPKCVQWRSGLIKISVELLQDSLFPVERLLADMAGTRLAMGVGKAMMTTLIAGSTSALTSAATTAVTPSELIDLVASIDSAYLGTSAFCMSAATLTSLRKLVTTSGGAFVFPAEARDAAGRPSLFGFPVFICPSAPAMTAGLKPIIFGAVNKLARRIVANSLVARVLVERFAELGEVAVETLYRTDSALLKSTNMQPTKFVTMHA